MDPISEDVRHRMIAEAAYHRAARRGFVGGDPVEDWLAAEAEVDARAGAPSGIGLLEQRLGLANERLAALRKRLAGATREVRDEWEDELKALARQRDRLRKRIGEMRKQGADTSESAMRKAEAVWQEIRASLERLSQRDRGRK